MNKIIREYSLHKLGFGGLPPEIIILEQLNNLTVVPHDANKVYNEYKDAGGITIFVYNTSSKAISVIQGVSKQLLTLHNNEKNYRHDSKEVEDIIRDYIEYLYNIEVRNVYISY